MVLGAEAQLNWLVIVIMMILAVSIAIIALRGLKEEKQSSEESVSEEVGDTVVSLQQVDDSGTEEDSKDSTSKKSGRHKKSEG